ncbi:MAG: pitrilysin family protein [Alphaproteobacteria bacterium]
MRLSGGMKSRVRMMAALAAAGLMLAGGLGHARAKVFGPETFTLKNGLQVVVVTNHRVPVVTHMVWYKVGAADEAPGESGLAHFLEHLMFRGTGKQAPGEFSRVVARNGGRDNAFTTQDYTAYFEHVARDRLEIVMRMEADRMTNLHLTDKVVLPEREVVLEERRSRIENDPGSLLNEAMSAALYYNLPYRDPVIGWNHEIQELTTEKATAFYKQFYAPDNAVLVIAGDVTAADVRPLAEKYFGGIPSRPIRPRVRPQEPEHHAALRVTLKDPRVGQPVWLREYLAPSYREGDTKHAYALQVLAELLGGGTSSRLYRSLVVEQKLAAAAVASYDPTDYDLGEFAIQVSPRAGVELSRIETAVDAEIAKLVSEAAPADEVERAKKSMLADAVYARDSMPAAARIIGTALTTGSTVEDVESWPDRIGAVTVAQVQAAARDVLVLRNSVTGELLAEPAS